MVGTLHLASLGQWLLTSSASSLHCPAVTVAWEPRARREPAAARCPEPVEGRLLCPVP